ncbi:hypothetical protein [Streptomyces lichenis]|uniref:Translation initiation factor IF-2 n=1 Tax=Streptomyces lichenis TaxID=2306967 RepID=A0ABT0IG77_9ACTN|nr:hypothetical protein [Streptomyces lichenis]MCK8680329.1 hypothetical protein [Streptomyces lichenis]
MVESEHRSRPSGDERGGGADPVPGPRRTRAGQPERLDRPECRESRSPDASRASAPSRGLPEPVPDLAAFLARLGRYLQDHEPEEVVVLLREELSRREFQAYVNGWRDAADEYEPALEEARRIAQGRRLRLVGRTPGQSAVIPFPQDRWGPDETATGAGAPPVPGKEATAPPRNGRAGGPAEPGAVREAGGPDAPGTRPSGGSSQPSPHREPDQEPPREPDRHREPHRRPPLGPSAPGSAPAAEPAPDPAEPAIRPVLVPKRRASRVPTIPRLTTSRAARHERPDPPAGPEHPAPDPGPAPSADSETPDPERPGSASGEAHPPP